jgi:ketosteroid isomerase-like protein
MRTATHFVRILMVWFAMSSQSGFAQQSPDQAPVRDAPVEKTIREYYAAFEKKDWNSMEQLLADGFTFSSPKDDHISVKSYKERCWPNAYKIKKFDLVKLIVSGDDAFVTYNGWTTDGKLFRNTEYFRFKGGKIKENECFFGPGLNYPNNTEK